jgi:hypothetical protein
MSDLDWLCEKASTEEVKRLMRLVQEWSQGDEHSFPVQMALLTRAQWRAAAALPPRIQEVHQGLEKKMAEHRAGMDSALKTFGEGTRGQIKNLAEQVKTHSEAITQAMAELKGQLEGAEAVADRIRFDLETGERSFETARLNFERERRQIAEEKKTFEEEKAQTQVPLFLMMLVGCLGIGIAVGISLAR